MTVTVIAGCISCGLCTEEFPNLFRMNDDGVAEAISPQVPAGKEGEARQAEEDCPVNVILTA
ncbi:MAG: ferredoxin [Ruminiclostridium sp.]|nr:ferredoxin [Ruminiclostridium sp.]